MGLSRHAIRVFKRDPRRRAPSQGIRLSNTKPLSLVGTIHRTTCFHCSGILVYGARRRKGRSLNTRGREPGGKSAPGRGARFLPAVSPFVATSSRTDNRVCANADRNVGAPRRPPGSLRPAPSLDEKCYLCPGLLRRGFQRIGVGYEASAMSIGEKGAGRRPPPLNPGGPRSNGSYLSLGEVVPSTRIPIPTGSGSSPLQEKIGETEPRSPAFSNSRMILKQVWVGKGTEVGSELLSRGFRCGDGEGGGGLRGRGSSAGLCCEQGNSSSFPLPLPSLKNPGPTGPSPGAVLPP